jgi:hypothetical protein
MQEFGNRFDDYDLKQSETRAEPTYFSRYFAALYNDD